MRYIPIAFLLYDQAHPDLYSSISILEQLLHRQMVSLTSQQLPCPFLFLENEHNA